MFAGKLRLAGELELAVPSPPPQAPREKAITTKITVLKFIFTPLSNHLKC